MCGICYLLSVKAVSVTPFPCQDISVGAPRDVGWAVPSTVLLSVAAAAELAAAAAASRPARWLPPPGPVAYPPPNGAPPPPAAPHGRLQVAMASWQAYSYAPPGGAPRPFPAPPPPPPSSAAMPAAFEARPPAAPLAPPDPEVARADKALRAHVDAFVAAPRPAVDARDRPLAADAALLRSAADEALALFPDNPPAFAAFADAAAKVAVAVAINAPGDDDAIESFARFAFAAGARAGVLLEKIIALLPDAQQVHSRLYARRTRQTTPVEHHAPTLDEVQDAQNLLFGTAAPDAPAAPEAAPVLDAEAPPVATAAAT